jgi:hypothetical protein
VAQRVLPGPDYIPTAEGGSEGKRDYRMREKWERDYTPMDDRILTYSLWK